MKTALEHKTLSKLLRGFWCTQRFSSMCCYSVLKSCPTLWDPMHCSTPGFLVFHHLPEFAQTHARLSWWYHPTISSAVTPFSSYLQSFPASGSFPKSQFHVDFCDWLAQQVRANSEAVQLLDRRVNFAWQFYSYPFLIYLMFFQTINSWATWEHGEIV